MIWTLGGDPEYFMKNRTGKPVPAHTLFGPKTQQVQQNQGYIYRDGYAVELNPFYSSCREVLFRNNRRLLDWVQAKAKKHNYVMCDDAAIAVDPKTLRRAPADVQQFGCEGSLCAYTHTEKHPTIDAYTHPWRYAGGHLHIGTFSPVPRIHQWITRPKDIELYVRMLDLYVGVPLTYWFHDRFQFLRRQYYGQAGEFRIQRYEEGVGVEYRTPPPQTWGHPVVLSYALGTMRGVARDYAQLKQQWKPTYESETRHAINTGEGLEKLLAKATLKGWSTKLQLREVRSLLKRRPALSSFHGWDWYRGRA